MIAWRTQRQQLHRRLPKKSLVDVAARIGGLHAQLMSSAELTAWARVNGVSRAGMQDDLWEHRRFVKTWAMRGTLHLIPSQEYWLWQSALGAGIGERSDQWLKWYGMTRKAFDKMQSAIATALDGDPLTREELSAAVARLTRSKELGEAVAGSWGSMLKPAAFTGDLCFAKGDGQKVRFTRPERLIGARVAVEPDHALREVTRRYFSVNGPGTREDLARWWGVRPPQARKMIDALGDELVAVDVEGRKGLALAPDVDAIRRAKPVRGVRLIPAFDQYVVGATRQVDAILPTAFRGKVYRPNAWFSAVVLVDGKMAGIWKHERKPKRIIVTIEPFAKLTKAAREAAAEEATAVARFLGGELELVWLS